MHHYRQHRNYRLWERPGRRQRTDSGGRHRHISSHVGGPQHHSLFLSRIADRGERSRHAGGGSPPGDQGQAVPALLSAASDAGPLGGRRGPDPLAASKTRPGVARRVHFAGRGDGLDSAAGRLGSGSRLCAACRLGRPQAIRPSHACSEHQRPAVPPAGLCRNGTVGPGALGRKPEKTQAGTHREHAGR